MGYLDDTFKWEIHLRDAKKTVLARAKLTTSLGFSIPTERSRLFPFQAIEQETQRK